MDNLEKKRKGGVVSFFRNNFQKILIILISLLYITQGLFGIAKREATLLEVLGNILLSIMVGVSIVSSFRSIGIKRGRTSEIFVESLKTYGEAKEKATPYFDKLSSWCSFKNSQDLEFKKKDIIQAAGLSWKAFKLGYYEDHMEKLNDAQKKAIETAKTCEIYLINSQELLSDLPKMKNSSKNRFGTDVNGYLKKNAIFDGAFRILAGVLWGLYTIKPLINSENVYQLLAGVLWNTTQIVFWTVSGIHTSNKACDFIENEYRQTHVIQKTELLNEFIITMQNNPDIIVTYEEDSELEEYIENYIKMKKVVEEKENEEERVLD